jgi:hypothetical protein
MKYVAITRPTETSEIEVEGERLHSCASLWRQGRPRISDSLDPTMLMPNSTLTRLAFRAWMQQRSRWPTE